MSGNKFFLSPKTSNLTNFQPPISLANLLITAGLKLAFPQFFGG